MKVIYRYLQCICQGLSTFFSPFMQAEVKDVGETSYFNNFVYKETLSFITACVLLVYILGIIPNSYNNFYLIVNCTHQLNC